MVSPLSVKIHWVIYLTLFTIVALAGVAAGVIANKNDEIAYLEKQLSKTEAGWQTYVNEMPDLSNGLRDCRLQTKECRSQLASVKESAHKYLKGFLRCWTTYVPNDPKHAAEIEQMRLGITDPR